MAPNTRQALQDVGALASNVCSSVLLIYSNKYLMSRTVGLGFTFGDLNSKLGCIDL